MYKSRPGFFTCFFLAFLCVIGAQASLAFDPTGYVVLTNGGNSTISPILTPGCWQWPGGTIPTEMDQSAKYYANLGTLYAVIRHDATMAGTELVLDKRSSSQYGSIRVSGAESVRGYTLTFPNLIALDKTCLRSWSFPSPTIAGKLTVQASVSNPFVALLEASTSSEDDCFRFNGLTVEGAAGTGFFLSGPPLSGDYSGFTRGAFKFTNCTLSGFRGQLRVGMSEGDPGTRNVRAVFRPVGDLTLGGELLCEAGGAVSLADVTTTLTVDTLTLEDGAVLELGAGGKTLTVQSALSAEGTVYLDCSSLAVTDDGGTSIVLSCANGATVTGMDTVTFVLLNGADRQGIPFAKTADVRWNAEAKTLSLVLSKLVTRNVSPANASGRSELYATTATDGGTDYYWSHQGCPATDANAADTIYRSVTKSTPTIQIAAANTTTNVYEFPGRLLVIGANRQISAAEKTLAGARADLVMQGSCSFSRVKGGRNQGYCHPESGAAMTTFFLRGGILFTSASSTMRFQCGYGNAYHQLFESELSGVGQMTLHGVMSSTPSGPAINVGTFELVADNSAFAGKIHVTQDYATAKTPAVQTPNADNNVHLVISDGRALGGACASFAYDALLLERYARLLVRTDVTLASGLNRGVAIGDCGGMWVPEGKRLTVNRPINLHGRLDKTGAGTLVLGGSSMTFGADGSSATPSANSNLVTVAAGRLRVTNAAAADGAAISLSEGASLAVGVGDTAETALRLVKTGSSLTAAGGSIPVVFDVAGVAPTAFTTVLCTSTDDDLSFACTAPWKGWKINVSSETSEGVTTYTATASNPGFILIFR